MLRAPSRTYSARPSGAAGEYRHHRPRRRERPRSRAGPEEARRPGGGCERADSGRSRGARRGTQPAHPMPARAEAEVDLQGRCIRARAVAPSIEAAVDDVAERLQRHLRRYVERFAARHREPAEPAPGEWSHRSWSPPRSPTFERRVEEREIIKTQDVSHSARCRSTRPPMRSRTSITTSSSSTTPARMPTRPSTGVKT